MAEVYSSMMVEKSTQDETRASRSNRGFGLTGTRRIKRHVVGSILKSRQTCQVSGTLANTTANRSAGPLLVVSRGFHQR